ncbi:MAG: hypothetical protein K0S44_1843 [Bacteroidetes bacterium]|jgi:hypothetical protein|nr:hypothetical protein [Bacteroidota bacterium]
MSALNKNIRIDYLCGQPFWKFSGKGDKEYCKVCKHHIHDLKEIGDKEINILVKENKNEFCGAFYEDQFAPDERTRYSPTSFKLILAGMISWFTATTKMNAQVSGAPVPTEQHYLGSDSVLTEKENINSPSEITEEVPVTVTKPSRKYLRIGKSQFYTSGKFPFIHKRKMMRGRFKASVRF